MPALRAGLGGDDYLHRMVLACRWLHWEHGLLEELVLPRVGEAVTVKAG